MKRDPRSAGKTPSLLQEQQLLNEQDRNLRDNVPSLSPDQRREMLEDNQRILSRMPPHEFAERLQRRLQEEEHSQPGDARIFNLATFRAAALAAAAASVILIGMLFVLPLQQRGSINVDGDVIRLKGPNSDCRCSVSSRMVMCNNSRRETGCVRVSRSSWRIALPVRTME